MIAQSTDILPHPVLTLKNLYRLISQSDYPMPSYPICSRSVLHGQTLVRF